MYNFKPVHMTTVSNKSFFSTVFQIIFSTFYIFKHKKIFRRNINCPFYQHTFLSYKNPSHFEIDGTCRTIPARITHRHSYAFKKHREILTPFLNPFFANINVHPQSRKIFISSTFSYPLHFRRLHIPKLHLLRI